MTIQQFSDQLQAKLQRLIEQRDTDRNDLVKLGELVSACRAAVGDLKAFTASYAFATEAEEIDFFKRIKPEFVCQLLFYRKLFALAWVDAFRELPARRENYQRILGDLEQYTVRHKHLYEYWVTGATDFDSEYFMRGRGKHAATDFDDRFTTRHDRRIARFMAYERLRRHIVSRLREEHDVGNSGLTWTAPKQGLIELLYALHAARVLNNGEADIKVIAGALETVFNVSLGNFYRKFQDFKFRKVDSTRFLDDLRAQLLQRIEESDR